MAENNRYPVATLHDFLQEASDEFRRFRFQAKLNLISSVFLLAILLRFTYLIFATSPVRRFTRVPLIVDAILLLVALAAVLWSLDVYRRQRKFVSRWGERFEKLDVIENKLLPDDSI